MRTGRSNVIAAAGGRVLRGFTLLELVIAVAIFSLVSVMAYSGLYSAQMTSQRVEEAGDRLSALQVAFSLMGRDLQQSVNRPVRDAFGEMQLAFMGARSGVGAMLEFTRTGLRNPAGFARSSLQRVAYGVEEDELLRLTWPSLDRGYGAEPVRTPILTGVKQVELRFMDIDRNWIDQWPPITAQTSTESLLPIAVEITVETEDLGKLVRLFRVPGDAPTLATMMATPSGTSGGATDQDTRRNEEEQNQNQGGDEDETSPADNDNDPLPDGSQINDPDSGSDPGGDFSQGDDELPVEDDFLPPDAGDDVEGIVSDGDLPSDGDLE